jgi:hypothetical protein
VAHAAPRKQIGTVSDVRVVLVTPAHEFEVLIFFFHFFTSRTALRTASPGKEASHRHFFHSELPTQRIEHGETFDAILCRPAQVEILRFRDRQLVGGFSAASLEGGSDL